MSHYQNAPPSWQLPEGVNASLWQYAQSHRLADEEDAYFQEHPLFEADRRALDARFVDPGPLIDLGCGAGRLSLHFAKRGFPVTAVDLSDPMLRKVNTKARIAEVGVQAVRANLCQLGCFRDASYSYALAMFSTIGMIRGGRSRRRALAEAARILQPGGTLALHAHNFWLNLHDPQGRRWLLSQAMHAFGRRSDLGDREMTYRGVPGMKVHLYRWGELISDLKSAGLEVVESLPLDAVTARSIACPNLLPQLRAGGWILFTRKIPGI